MTKHHGFFLFAFFSTIVFSAENKIQLNVDFPSLQVERTANVTNISMEGLLKTMEGGLPSVPVRTIKIAIPDGKSFLAASWTAKPISRTRLDAPISLADAQMPISWMQNPPRHLKAVPAPTFRGNSFPAGAYEVSEQKLHGVTVLIVNVYPVLVGRDLKTLNVSQGGTLSIELKEGPKLESRPFSHQLEEVAQFIDNPEVVESFAANGVRRGSSYDYLIISTASYISFSGDNDFSKLQSSLKSRGLESKIVDQATIAATSTGADLTDKIRNYIRQEYSVAGIRYVLLAGESRESKPDFIPARKLWSKVMAYFGGGMPWTPVELDIPSDLYYSNLDGEFNNNGNTHWGELNDGPKGGDVDFLSEVKVGRVALRATTDLQNFVKKTVQAGSNGISKNVLLLGEMLFKEKDLYGDEYMEQLIGSVEDHGFKTVGYSGDWKNTKLYDRKQEWTGSAAQTQVNQSDFGMVNHLGHSNNTTNMRLSSSKIASFTNANPFIYYTQGCYAAGFDTGSFVDRMVSAANAAVVAVGNSVYGLAPEDPEPTTTKTPGGSQMLHRAFIHSLMSAPHVALAKAHSASKEFFVGLKSAQEVRWVNWTATYFGDPSMTLDR